MSVARSAALCCQNAGGPSIFFFYATRREHVPYSSKRKIAQACYRPHPPFFLSSERCCCCVLCNRLSGSSVLILAKARALVLVLACHSQSACTQKLGSGVGGSGGSPAASRSTKDQGLGAKDQALGGAFQMGVAYPLIEGRLHWASVRIEVTEPGCFFLPNNFLCYASPKTPCLTCPE